MRYGKKLLLIQIIVIFAVLLTAAFGIGDGIKGITHMRYGIDIRGGIEAVFEPQGIERDATDAEMEAARNVLENRMDALNISDRVVTIDKKEDYLLVQFPWKSEESNFDPASAIMELGEMAKLTFRDPEGNILLEGKNVVSAAPVIGNSDTGLQQKNYEVELTFDEIGAKKFEEATGKLIGQPMGIYMDEDIISNPKVQTKITGNNAVITNLEDYETAEKLADKINAGALPFSLDTTSFSTISPTMGLKALQVMEVAALIALFLVCLFMICYYRLPGIIACVTLLFQVALQLLCLSVPQYTLTLPGIAGIILSIGMAVDANIIISERISDELRKGLTLKSAVTTGYKNAFSSVLDGNVTTAIVAVILMIFGSGSMLSFGYTLLMGMIINVFAAVNLSKSLLLSFLQIKDINAVKWFRQKKELKIYPFYQKKWVYAAITGSVFLIGIVSIFINGVKLDTQFTGGAVLTFTVDGDVDINRMEQKVTDLLNRPATIQVVTDHITGEESISVTLAGQQGLSATQLQDVTKVLQNDNSKVSLKQTYVVEPYIGAKALKNSIIAIILSFVFILIYVWLRFKKISGLAAGVTGLIALFHDVLVVFFVFCVAGISLNDSFVAVVLTIIGYSINDTIVLYDRIRENRRNYPERMEGSQYMEIVDISTSQTMVRSINTSVTTGMCILIILLAAVVFSIPSIYCFALPMFFGIISGCYSSVCIAGTLWAVFEKNKKERK